MKRLMGLLIIVFMVVAYSYYQPKKDMSLVVNTKTQQMPSVTPSIVSSNTPVPDIPTSIPSPFPSATPTSVPVVTTNSQYRDGQYTGDVADAGEYGQVQVAVIVSSGKIADVQFLQFPNDRRTSIFINQQAMPLLKSEALQAQSASVDIISGASSTSEAFQITLASALSKAKNS